MLYYTTICTYRWTALVRLRHLSDTVRILLVAVSSLSAGTRPAHLRSCRRRRQQQQRIECQFRWRVGDGDFRRIKLMNVRQRFIVFYFDLQESCGTMNVKYTRWTEYWRKQNSDRPNTFNIPCFCAFVTICLNHQVGLFLDVECGLPINTWLRLRLQRFCIQVAIQLQPSVVS